MAIEEPHHHNGHDDGYDDPVIFKPSFFKPYKLNHDDGFY